VSDGQLERWRIAFPSAEIGVVYGSTEAEPVAHASAEERLSEQAGVARGFLVGTPVQAVRTRVVRITKEPIIINEKSAWPALECAAGEVGELVVAGKHVCVSYEGDDEAMRHTKIRDLDGTVWHRMGDTGSFDERGRFWLAGRVHSTIVRNGIAIHAQQAERVATQDDAAIERAAVIGLRDARLGERVVVILKSGDAAAKERASERLREAGIAFDEVVVTAEPLPVDPRHNSKIDYSALRQRLEQR
jgi:acyl-CoA synthetase (AMP-forming)/AMP-acid ligase II